MGERVPQHVQNIVIKDFCKRKKLNFLLSATEYSMSNSFYILKELLENLSDIHGIVAYSVFQMPSDDKERKKIFNKILKNKKSIYFAVEQMEVSTTNELKRVNQLWNVKKTLPNCLGDLNE